MENVNRKKDEIDIIKLIQDNFNFAKECEFKVEETKQEYKAATSYLVDIQKIDMIPQEDRGEIDNAARKIVNLTKERAKFQNTSSKINKQQIMAFERYEGQVSQEISKIKAGEKVRSDIFLDFDYLNEDRLKYVRAKNESIQRQKSLKGIAIMTFLAVISLFVFFVLLGEKGGLDLDVPFLITIIMGAVISVFVYMGVRKNMYNMKVIEIRLNENILLMNKVKIRGINNQNYLEYMYIKYRVEGFEELLDAWEEYVALKDAESIYRESSEVLEFYNQELIKGLEGYGVEDAEVWIYQPTALIDEKEMVEVRHRLNQRRQKARENINENQEQKEIASKEVEKLLAVYPQYSDLIK